MANIIEVHHLTHRFGSRVALDDLTFSVAAGEVFGLLGHNGAGKTTTVRLLNGVLAPAGGRLRVLGLDPVTQGCELRRSSGVLTETPSLYERLTARDNLATFAALYGVPQAALDRRVSELLDRFELSSRAAERVGGFSKGMKQRLALARALIHDPQLLFLDEPTAGLDPQAALQVTQLIAQLSQQQGRTVVLCTHNLDEAQRLCDRVAILSQGRLLALGTLAELSHTLWRGCWVDVQLAGALPAPARAAVERLPGIRGLEGEGLRLAAQLDAPARTPDLVAALVGQGARILQVTPRQYSLEEIYFELQKQSEAKQSEETQTQEKQTEGKQTKGEQP